MTQTLLNMPGLVTPCKLAVVANPLLLESRSLILGALPDAVDVTATLQVQFQPDDRNVLYTDGITEVFDSRAEMLGISGVQEIVRKRRPCLPRK